MDDRRILFLDHETRLSGGQLVLRDLITGLVDAGVDVHLAVPGPGDLPTAAEAAGARVHHFRLDRSLAAVSRWDLARRPWAAFSQATAIGRSTRDVHRLVHQLRPAIVHTNSLKAHLLAIPATRSARIPQVWHVHDILTGTPQRIFTAAARVGATRLICISETAASPLRGRLGPRITVVHNGIPQRAADRQAARRFRESTGASDDQLLVTMVGQIAEWKGQDVMIEAARLLSDRNDIRWAVVGECLYPANEATFETRVRAASASLDHVRWMGPVTPIEPVMAASDIIVHASRLPEPFGRVIVEAMVQSTPVISTSIGSGPELVPPDAGVLVPPGDAAALGSAVAALADDADRRTLMGDAARRAASRFTTETMVRGVDTVHRKVLSGG